MAACIDTPSTSLFAQSLYRSNREYFLDPIYEPLLFHASGRRISRPSRFSTIFYPSSTSQMESDDPSGSKSSGSTQEPRHDSVGSNASSSTAEQANTASGGGAAAEQRLQVQRTSCERCRRMKLACQRDTALGTTCRRCARAGAQCIFLASRKGKRPERPKNLESRSQSNISSSSAGDDQGAAGSAEGDRKSRSNRAAKIVFVQDESFKFSQPSGSGSRRRSSTRKEQSPRTSNRQSPAVSTAESSPQLETEAALRHLDSMLSFENSSGVLDFDSRVELERSLLSASEPSLFSSDLSEYRMSCLHRLSDLHLRLFEVADTISSTFSFLGPALQQLPPQFSHLHVQDIWGIQHELLLDHQQQPDPALYINQQQPGHTATSTFSHARAVEESERLMERDENSFPMTGVMQCARDFVTLLSEYVNSLPALQAFGSSSGQTPATGVDSGDRMMISIVSLKFFTTMAMLFEYLERYLEHQPPVDPSATSSAGPGYDQGWSIQRPVALRLRIGTFAFHNIEEVRTVAVTCQLGLDTTEQVLDRASALFVQNVTGPITLDQVGQNVGNDVDLGNIASQFSAMSPSMSDFPWWPTSGELAASMEEVHPSLGQDEFGIYHGEPQTSIINESEASSHLASGMGLPQYHVLQSHMDQPQIETAPRDLNLAVDMQAAGDGSLEQMAIYNYSMAELVSERIRSILRRFCLR